MCEAYAKHFNNAPNKQKWSVRLKCVGRLYKEFFWKPPTCESSKHFIVLKFSSLFINIRVRKSVYRGNLLRLTLLSFATWADCGSNLGDVGQASLFSVLSSRSCLSTKARTCSHHSIVFFLCFVFIHFTRRDFAFCSFPMTSHLIRVSKRRRTVHQGMIQLKVSLNKAITTVHSTRV